MGRLLMLKAFFSRPMKRRKAPLQKPNVFFSVGRVSGMLEWVVLVVRRLEVMDMLRGWVLLLVRVGMGTALVVVWVEGEREAMEGFVVGCWYWYCCGCGCGCGCWRGGWWLW
jgi:hypothetical protein